MRRQAGTLLCARFATGHHRSVAPTLLLTTALLVALAGCSTSAPDSSAHGSSRATSGASPLPFLHVVVPPTTGAGSRSGPGGSSTPYLADPGGRQVLLTGVDVVGIQDNSYVGGEGKPPLLPFDPAAYTGRCPKGSSLEKVLPTCEVDAASGEWVSTAPGRGNDVAQIRALGFDVVRLAVSWSLLEPRPGRYSHTYLARIAQFVSWARTQGIYVILDMHEDQYSRYVLPTPGQKLPSGCTTDTLGNDGAPAWAVFTDGKPACGLFGERALDPASAAATDAFFQNRTVPGARGSAPGTGLQDHYIGALADLAGSFAHDPTVLGYEIMNEPPVPSTAPLPLANLYEASATQLYPFYRRVIEALTGVRDGLATCPAAHPTSLAGSCAYPALEHVDHQAIFYEPFGLRNVFGFAPQVPRPFSSYPDLVYAPHVYTHVFTADATVLHAAPTTSPYPPSYGFGYATALAAARAMRSAVFVTEFGNPPSEDGTVLAGTTRAQQAALVGASLWAWSGTSTEPSLGDCWAIVCSYVGPARAPGHAASVPRRITSRVTYLSRVSPRSTAGTLLSYADDPKSGAFAMIAVDHHRVAPGARDLETVLYVPPRVSGPVRVTGAAVLAATTSRPDGSRLVAVAPSGGGRYGVEVGDPDASVVQTARARAASPIQPIAEPTARATLEHTLARLASSLDPALRAGAAQVDALLPLVLGTGPDPNGAPAEQTAAPTP